MPEPLKSDPTPPPNDRETIPPRANVEKLDQARLLTETLLSLSQHIKVTVLDETHLVAKYEPGQAYLTINQNQWQILKMFPETGLSAPQVLFRLISDRKCPPLREFYELVVKAFDAGLLQAKSQEPPEEQPPARWKSMASGRWVGRVSIVACLMAALGLWLNPFIIPDSNQTLFIAWLLICVSLSLGYILAGCVIRHANAEVYHPRLNWQTLFPHFQIDTDDAVMGGKNCEFDVATSRLAPPLLFLGLSAFFYPQASLPLFALLLFMLSPFWWSPGLQLLHSRYGKPALDAFRRFRFEPNKLIWVALRLRFKNSDFRFFRLHLSFTIIWLFILLLTGLLPLQSQADEIWRAYQSVNGPHLTALVLMVTLGLAALTGFLGFFAIFVSWWMHQQTLSRLNRNPVPPLQDLSLPSIRTILDHCLLLQSLSKDERYAIARLGKIKEHSRRRIVLHQKEKGEYFYLILSGRLEVLNNSASIRTERMAMFTAGDVFGEIDLLRSPPATRSIRTLSRTTLLTLTQDLFNLLIPDLATREQVTKIVQKVAFLHHISLSSNWPQAAMVSFAHRAVAQVCPPGSVLIKEGQETPYFYLLYEGELSVQHRGNEIDRLHAGDFFGEISALQNSIATASVVAHDEAVCLVMSKSDFLQFLVNDFLIGLQFEQISSKRLGSPVFPPRDRTGEVLR